MSNNIIPELDWERIYILIDLALTEDLGKDGDITSNAVIPKAMTAQATLICKENCICAGMPIAEKVFSIVDPAIEYTILQHDGSFCKSGTKLAKVRGNAISLLTAERTALNFLQRLSGIATTANRYSTKLGEGSKTVILDTRKTTPGWRNLEKYAVAVGGAENHRIGLYDRIMIKDNHRVLAGFEEDGGIKKSVAKARQAYPNLQVEVEADTLDQVKESIEAKADYILLDNMTNEEMIEAVAMNSGNAKLEASGGITLERISTMTDIGVDYISIGALTHSVKAIDISMEITNERT